MWEVEYTNDFEAWWNTLDARDQGAVDASVRLLEQEGPNLKFPYSSGAHNSRHSAMRELRTQSGGRPLRTFYIFDPRRTAILLIGGDKTGNDRFYEEFIPVADDIYDQYLKETGS
ncbi:MAG: type II toxin-antitoxin system RelE/ParE family toxin [Treponema sp.]|jgi:hypothetical protein|nr:type II toxin-antitoxin system RelE/ParE family toxin [Treponema sp.]